MLSLGLSIPARCAAAVRTPALVLDFLSEVLDSRVTFTSAGGGTYYDANGVQQTAAANQPRFDHRSDTLAPRGLRIDAGESAMLLLSSIPGWTASAFTLVVEAELSAAGTANALAQLDDGTNNNIARLVRLATGTMRGLVTTGAVTQASITSAGTAGAVVTRAALAVQANDFVFASAGTHVLPDDTAGTVPTVTTLRLGMAATGIQPLAGWLRRVAIYPRRLPAAELQRLTV